MGDIDCFDSFVQTLMLRFVSLLIDRDWLYFSDLCMCKYTLEYDPRTNYFFF